MQTSGAALSTVATIVAIMPAIASEGWVATSLVPTSSSACRSRIPGANAFRTRQSRLPLVSPPAPKFTASAGSNWRQSASGHPAMSESPRRIASGSRVRRVSIRRSIQSG
jgi:hypothetical protein